MMAAHLKDEHGSDVTKILATERKPGRKPKRDRRAPVNAIPQPAFTHRAYGVEVEWLAKTAAWPLGTRPGLAVHRRMQPPGPHGRLAERLR